MASTVVSTTLTFGLVSTDVKLKKPSEKKDPSFNLASPDGNPVKQMYRDEVTAELFEPAALTKGIFDSEGFHEVGKDALAAIDAECKLDALSIEKFIPLADVPFERVTGSYFIAPGGKGGPTAVKPLALLRDGLKDQQRAGIGKVSVRAKTYPVAIYERNGGLFVSLMLYADEAAQAAEASETLAGVETDEQTLALAKTLFDQLAGTREDLDALTDDRRAKREVLVAKALAGETIEVTPKAEAVAEPTADLAAMLAASIGANVEEPAAPKKKAAKKEKVAA